jgi:DNA polymerase III subunit gamma/tau
MALYHTYRPQTFADVLGQEIITTTLSNQILSHRTAHAYLFSGPRGVGKTTTARIIAKALSCKQRADGSAEPCNTCSACTSITEGTAIDIIEIDAASNTGVDHVREVIIESANTRPTSLSYKIFIIDEVHMLSKSAFNALLKTLEEPPKHVMFVLATTEPEKLPDTIISRCQHFHFRNIPDDILHTHIETLAKKESVTIDPSIIDRIVKKSGGCGRDAVRFLDQLLGLGVKHITLDDANALFPVVADEWVISFLNYLLSKNAPLALTHVMHAQDQGQHMHTLLERTLEILRAVLVYSVTHTSPHGETIDTSSLETLNEKSTMSECVRLFDLLTKRQQHMDILPLPSYALELVIYEWCIVEQASTPTPPQRPSAKEKTPIAPSKNTEQPINQTTPPPLNPTSIPVETSTPTLSPTTATDTSVNELQTTPTHTPSSTDISFTKEHVDAIWSAFITYIENNSPSLAFIIHMAQIVSVTNGTITISVPYSFHCDKIKQAKSYSTLTSTLATLLSVSHVVLDVVVTNTESSNDEAPTGVSDLTAAFGGQMVSV